ncbi:hypothetical protein DFH07DRAFT_823511 [Mycena maculata]|uniref:EF-hand domain-containing protein n=1 Tax=Mycena maculata TaxID=230809 RepID=A0AAD7J3Z0_9AGAR|nr:hypothetical protein DFH07DRAFT_823511 [Mycena maculata]
MSSTNDSFSALPQYLQHRIDKAFVESVPSAGSDPLDSGGGFVAGVTGGFLAEDRAQIPLSAIPTALQRLDLPPDDEQVLLVFKNAASGWKSSSNKPDEIGEEAAVYVSRDDWRSVCAVLFEHHAEEYEDSDGGAVGDQPYVDSSGEDDEYQEPEPDSDSDEYIEGPSTSRRRTRMKRRARSSSSSASSISSPKKLTSRQTKTCLETYALFFPSASESDLPNQRIMIKDVQRLSKLIGDTLKGEDIIEMLAEFSTSPDKSMSFADFGSMMVAARLA